MPFSWGNVKKGEIRYNAGGQAGNVNIKGFDPNTGTITWQSPLGVMGKTKLRPEEVTEYLKFGNNASETKFEDMGLARRAGITPANVAAVNAGQTDAAATDPLDARIQEFLDLLNKPLDTNDPYVQRIIRGASGAASTAARNRGIEGGLAAAATEQNTASALSGLEGQRLDRYGQALNMASNRDLNKQNTALNMERLAQQQYETEMGLAAQQHGQSGLGAMVGMGAGALVGGIATAYSGGSAAPAVPGLIAGGGALGAGLERSFAGPYRPSPRKRGLGGY